MGEEHTEFWWGRPHGKKPLGRPWHVWEVVMKIDPQLMG